jgi:hypothetical protein
LTWAIGFRWTGWLYRAGNARIGESIAQRSQRSQRGDRGRRKALGREGGFWAGNARIGEGIAQRSRRSQRGESASWTRRALGGQGGFRAGNVRIGKASHRGHGGHRGGIGVVDAKGFGGQGGFRAGNVRIGKASHRGHGGHRGGPGVVDERLWEDRVASGRETRALGESIAQRSQRGFGVVDAKGFGWLPGGKRAENVTSGLRLPYWLVDRQ